MNASRYLAPLLVAGLCSMTACSSAPGGDTGPVATDDTEEALSANTAISRADEWVNARLHYCQSPNHTRDYDQACSKYCERTNNSAWNPYRSDCSGLVSWAWKLHAPGRTTYEFYPFQSDITRGIKANDLEPGDAVNNADHVMLFKSWVTRGKVARFIEEPGCSSSTPYAHELTTGVSVNGEKIYVDWNGMTFTAIRYNKLTH